MSCEISGDTSGGRTSQAEAPGRSEPHVYQESGSPGEPGPPGAGVGGNK